MTRKSHVALLLVATRWSVGQLSIYTLDLFVCTRRNAARRVSTLDNGAVCDFRQVSSPKYSCILIEITSL